MLGYGRPKRQKKAAHEDCMLFSPAREKVFIDHYATAVLSMASRLSQGGNDESASG